MAIVRIVNDSYKLETEEESLVVSSISDYVDACIRIIHSIHANEHLNVLARDPNCFRWLSRLEGEYGTSFIETRTTSPRNLIKRRWQLETLPKDITDKNILETGLLDLEISANQADNFQDIVLGNFFSNYMIFPEFPVGRLVELVSDLVSGPKWAEKRRNTLIARQYDRRLEEWEQKTEENDFLFLIEELRESPADLQKKMMSYKILKSYPYEVGKRVLGGHYEVFRKLNLDLTELPLHDSEVVHAKEEIEIYLNQNIQVDSIEKMEDLLAILSGELLEEFNVARKSIENLKEDVTEDIIRQVKDTFFPISSRIQPELHELGLLIPPSKPSAPNKSWDADKWTRWAVEEYFPYHFWLEERNEYEKEVALYSERFGDWFFDNYIELKTSFPRILHKAVPNLCHDIRQEAGVSLILMIDNFNYKYLSDFEELLKKHGYFCTKKEPYFSLIPTVTEIGKKSLFSGQHEIAKIANKSHEQIIKNTWPEFVEGKSFKFCSNLGKLKEVKKNTHDVYFLNYCEIDELLHKSEDRIGNSHRDEVVHAMQKLVAGAVNFAKRLGIEHSLTVHVCSDHGSTKILGEVANLIDRDYYKAESENEYHRYVRLSDEQMEHLPSHVEDNCYVLGRKEYGLPENVLVAKGYSRFKKTSGKHYVHGGLSPEEVIVPFASYSKIDAKPTMPRIQLVQDTFRYSVKSKITIDVANINEYEMSDIDIDIKNSNVEYEPRGIDRIGAKNREQVELTARFRKTPSKKEKEFLLLQIHYGFLGKRHSENLELPITLKSIVEQNADLEDIF